MLDIINNIDPINYIIQDVLNQVNGRTLSARNNFFQGEGYALDVVQKRKNNFVLRFRAANLQNICSVSLDKKGIVIRYSPEFFLQMENAESGVLESNIVKVPFSIEELSQAFVDSRTMFDIGIDFNHEVMVQTIQLCRRVHNEFVSSIIV